MDDRVLSGMFPPRMTCNPMRLFQQRPRNLLSQSNTQRHSSSEAHIREFQPYFVR